MANGKDPKKQKIMTAMEAAGVSFGDEDPFGAAESVYTEAYGSPTTFSSEEERMLATLMGEIQSNQPVKASRGIQSGIPGNPRSVSLTGLSQGLNELAASMATSRNRDRLIGDPDAVDRFTASANQKLKKASQLKAEAQKMPDVINLDTGMNPMDNTIKFQLLEDAKALEEEAQKELKSADENAGLLAKARDLSVKKERAVNEENFRDQFIQKFGTEAYRQQQQTGRTVKAQEEATERTRLTQERMLKSTEVREREASKRARINADKAAKNSTSKLKIPDKQKPDYVQEFAKTYKEGLKDSIKEIEQSQEYQLDLLSEDLKNRYEFLKWKQTFADDVHLDATFYEEADFEAGLPDNRRPSDLEREKIEKAKRAEIPQELIDAYMYYNRLSFNAEPTLPGTNKKEPDSAQDYFNDE